MDIHNLVDEKYSNPFTEESQDLIVLDSQDIVGHHVTETTSICLPKHKHRFCHHHFNFSINLNLILNFYIL